MSPSDLTLSPDRVIGVTMIGGQAQRCIEYRWGRVKAAVRGAPQATSPGLLMAAATYGFSSCSLEAWSTGCPRTETGQATSR